MQTLLNAMANRVARRRRDDRTIMTYSYREAACDILANRACLSCKHIVA